ncbi:MAG: hypothetical protein M3R54_08915 [Chloroflexota bacterium]|nr:hypothetical protein [Chloroflexota bacterium]
MKDQWMRLASTLALSAVLVSGCAPAATLATPSPTPTATSTASQTKPVTNQASLPAPTYARWAIDKSDFPGRPYLLELYYDGIATSFRIIDATGLVILRLPIAGSGVFGTETCMVSARPPGKTEGATWISIDAATYQQFVATAASYRVEADSVGGVVVTVPLTDSGCRRV